MLRHQPETGAPVATSRRNAREVSPVETGHSDPRKSAGAAILDRTSAATTSIAP